MGRHRPASARTPVTAAGVGTYPPQGRRVATRRDRGQSVAEFALTLPFLLVMLLVTLDVGQLFFVYVGVENAAREAAAYAATSPLCQTGGATCADPQILAIARRESGGDATLVVDATTCSASCTRSTGLTEHRVTVSVSRPFPLIGGVTTVPGLGGTTMPVLTLGASATAVIQ